MTKNCYLYKLGDKHWSGIWIDSQVYYYCECKVTHLYRCLKTLKLFSFCFILEKLLSTLERCRCVWCVLVCIQSVILKLFESLVPLVLDQICPQIAGIIDFKKTTWICKKVGRQPQIYFYIKITLPMSI